MLNVVVSRPKPFAAHGRCTFMDRIKLRKQIKNTILAIHTSLNMNTTGCGTTLVLEVLMSAIWWASPGPTFMLNLVGSRPKPLAADGRNMFLGIRLR